MSRTSGDAKWVRSSTKSMARSSDHLDVALCQDLLSEDITERTERATDQALATAIHGRRETDMRNLDEIAAAILRVDAESYGKCLDCGGPIASMRLLVRPEAPYCSECAEARETGDRTSA
jgi:RNA polymerase-binding transcription factor DksA